MVIYLMHPKHGSKVACSEAEAAYDESNGWFRVGSVTPANDEAQDLRAQYQAKFGKAPHHKLGVAKIKEQLAA